MKILNLYAGIGGNRKLWGDKHEVTAVELDPQIAAIYQDFFPNDKLIVTDAHNYLLEHFKEFDFIWSSPPCPTHSKINYSNGGRWKVKYPDMRLYQEIILLCSWFKGKWVVENVRSYYKPLIKPQQSGRHFFWCNFMIDNLKYKVNVGAMNKGGHRKRTIREAQIPELIQLHELDDFKVSNKRQILRNCVNPKLGLHVFKMAFKEKQVRL